jgi:hypothetical protein
MIRFLRILWCCMTHKDAMSVRGEGDWNHVICGKCESDIAYWVEPR